jgi:hypothetical protein
VETATKKGFNNKAVSDYSRAIETNPNFAKVYLNRVTADRGRGS